MNSANICDSSGGVRKCSEERLSSTETLIALLNGFLKFLTSERFANLLSINSECMKKKQLWRCIQNFKDGCNTFRLKSCTTDKYLSIDESGNVECKYDDGTDLCDFEFVSSQYTGFVHIRSFKFRLYLGGSENVTANSKAPTSGELWSIRLHTHPYINIFNVDAGLYASIKDEDNGVEMGSRLAWDPRSSLFKLEEAEKRFYVVKTGQSQKYVCNDGSLSSRLTNKSLFYIHLQKYGLTLQSCDGSYLYSSQGKFIKSKKVRKIGNEGVWRFVVPIEKVCFKFQACQKFWSLKHSKSSSKTLFLFSVNALLSGNFDA